MGIFNKAKAVESYTEGVLHSRITELSRLMQVNNEAIIFLKNDLDRRTEQAEIYRKQIAELQAALEVLDHA